MSVTSVGSIGSIYPDKVAALWRALHPDWGWLESLEERAKVFKSLTNGDIVGYFVQRDGTVIATALSAHSECNICPQPKNWPRTRFIDIDVRPEDVAPEWVGIILSSFIDVDCDEPDVWQVVNIREVLLPRLGRLLEAAGFFQHSSLVRMEWRGEAVALAEPGTARLERYAGGNQNIDRAIVDLHNRAYRPSRLVPPLDLDHLWRQGSHAGTREYVLATENNRLVGYAECSVVDGNPWINSLVAARSHWGTAVAAAAGTMAMQIFVERGYRKIDSAVRSNNAAAIQLNLRHGWRLASELTHTFVRKFF
jgi:hypothetical protein